jgi:xylitol oxidase
LAWMAKQKLTNWAGNLTYGTDRLREASSVEQIRSLLRSEDKVKVLGTRHCFNSIADSRYNLLSLKPMHEVVALDPAARTVRHRKTITFTTDVSCLDESCSSIRHEICGASD